jgi:prepilin-type N-terminal cleavage/methylation domain-containing protein
MGINKTKNGFTLIEVLFTLSISLLIVFSITSIISLTRGREELKIIKANTEIGIKSLSQDIYVGSNFRYGEILEYKDPLGETNRVYLHNKRVVREPGFVIYMHDIDIIFFNKKGAYIYMKVVKGDIEKMFLIGIDMSYD